MFGERLAAQSDPAVPARTGLQQALSDYILAFEAIPVRGVTLFARARLDEATFRDQSSGDRGQFQPRPRIRLRQLSAGSAVALGTPLKSLDVHGEGFLTSHWGVTTYAIIDSGTWRRQDVGLVYRDNCVRVEVLYRHDNTQNGTLGPSTSVVLAPHARHVRRLRLQSLGVRRRRERGAVPAKVMTMRRRVLAPVRGMMAIAPSAWRYGAGVGAAPAARPSRDAQRAAAAARRTAPGPRRAGLVRIAWSRPSTTRSSRPTTWSSGCAC